MSLRLIELPRVLRSAQATCGLVGGSRRSGGAEPEAPGSADLRANRAPFARERKLTRSSDWRTTSASRAASCGPVVIEILRHRRVASLSGSEFIASRC
jgi:hypothetical protein